MAHLSLSFLGTFEVTLAGQPVADLKYDKVRALLAYLAVEADRRHLRGVLAGLLWPGGPEAKARHNLSQALLTLQRAIADRQATPPLPARHPTGPPIQPDRRLRTGCHRIYQPAGLLRGTRSHSAGGL